MSGHISDHIGAQILPATAAATQHQPACCAPQVLCRAGNDVSGCRFVVWRTLATGCCLQGLSLSALVLSRPLLWLRTGSYRRENLCCCSQAVVERWVGSMVILVADGSTLCSHVPAIPSQQAWSRKSAMK